MVDWPQRILDARVSLCKTLQEHHAFVSRHTEILHLADEFENLKELLPSLSGLHSVSSEPGDVSLSATTAHANVVSQLQEAIDMYSNCLYLLDVHRALESLSSSVKQLCQLTSHNTQSWHSEPAEFIRLELEDEEEFDVNNEDHEKYIDGKTKPDLDRLRSSEVCEIDESAFKFATSAVISALNEVHTLMDKPARFNKDDALVFQGFCRSLRDYKMTLNEHIDGLWREWFVWSKQPRQPSRSGGQLPVGLPQLLAELGLAASSATVPSTMEMSEFLDRLGNDRITSPTNKQTPSSLLITFTVLAKPKLLIQLFRLINALGDSSGRFRELSMSLWTNLFEPWLNKVPCGENVSKVEMDWPILRTRYFEETVDSNKDVDYVEDDCAADSDCPRLLPAWRLELIAPDHASYKTDNLILSSCQQLTSVLQELSTYVFSLNDTAPRPICEFFDEHMVQALIDGRFTSVLPSAKECRSLDFLAPITQVVYSLASAGLDAGFFSGVLDEDSLTRSTGGGATALLRWVRDLSRLSENRRTAEILSQARSILADPENFRFTHLAGADCCLKPSKEDGLLELCEEVDDDALTPEEMQLYQKQAKDHAAGDGPPILPSLASLLEAKVNREDLARYLDLGHFHFPLCKISKSTPALMNLVKSVVSEAESYLNHLVAQTNQISEDQRSTSLTLVSAILELIPRLIMSYTSLIPVFHAKEMEKDLYLVSLYHNNCMFLAHECLTLGETFLYPMLEKIHSLDPARPDSPALEQLAAVSTCILVPHLRTSGTSMLLTRLRSCRDQLVSMLKETRGFRDVGVHDNRLRCAKSLDACFDLLRTVSCGLRPLPLTVYYRSLGVICNHLCKEIFDSVIRLIDLTTEDCDALVSLLKDVEIEVEQYFLQTPDPELLPKEISDAKKQFFVGLVSRRVPDLTCLRGLVAVLTAPSMAIIENVLWNGGQGPLTTDHRMQPNQLRALIEAVYAQSTARDRFLAKLR